MLQRFAYPRTLPVWAAGHTLDESLELTVPAVKSRLLRARLQLRDKLTRFFKRKGDDAFAYM